MPNDPTGLYQERDGRGRTVLPTVKVTLEYGERLFTDDASLAEVTSDGFKAYYEEALIPHLEATFNEHFVPIGPTRVPKLYERARDPEQAGALGYVADQGYMNSGIRKCCAYLDSDAPRGWEAFLQWMDTHMAGSRGVDGRELRAIRMAKGEKVDVTVTVLAKTQAEVDAYRRKHEKAAEEEPPPRKKKKKKRAYSDDD